VYYLLPTLAFTGVAISNFAHVSFGIYLKYQALIDCYHQQKINQRYEEMLETGIEAKDTQNPTKMQKNESIIL